MPKMDIACVRRTIETEHDSLVANIVPFSRNSKYLSKTFRLDIEKGERASRQVLLEVQKALGNFQSNKETSPYTLPENKETSSYVASRYPISFC